MNMRLYFISKTLCYKIEQKSPKIWLRGGTHVWILLLFFPTKYEKVELNAWAQWDVTWRGEVLQSPHDFPAALLLVTRPEPAVWVRSAPAHTHTHTHTRNRTEPHRTTAEFNPPPPATDWAKHRICCNIQFRIGCNYLRQASNPKKKAAGGEGLGWDVSNRLSLFLFFFFLFSLFHEARPHHLPQPDNNTLQWGRIGRDWRASAGVGFVDHQSSVGLGQLR